MQQPRAMLVPKLLARSLTATAPRCCYASTLVFGEHNDGKLAQVTLNALTAAKKLSQGDITCLVIFQQMLNVVRSNNEHYLRGQVAGKNAAKAAESLAKVDGVKRVCVCDDDQYSHSLPEKVTPLILTMQEKHKFTHILAGSSAIGKGIIPRVAAKLDVSPISDIIGINGDDTFTRTMYAGDAVCKLKSTAKVKLITVRGTAFDAAKPAGGSAAVEKVEPVRGGTQAESEWLSAELTKSDRPELGSARIVVSGGRGLKSAENFKLIYDLVSALSSCLTMLCQQCACRRIDWAQEWARHAPPSMPATRPTICRWDRLARSSLRSYTSPSLSRVPFNTLLA